MLVRRCVMLLPMVWALSGCQQYGVNGPKGETAGVPETGGGARRGTRTVFTVAVRADYTGTWTDGVIDRSKACYVETEAGTDYSGCCPSGFTPVGFRADSDAGGFCPQLYVQCLEDAPGTGRAVVVVGLGDESWQEEWGASPSATPGGTWTGGTYSSESCAVDVRDDALPYRMSNPPDDYTRCCPPGFVAVGSATPSYYAEVVCLESL